MTPQAMRCILPCATTDAAIDIFAMSDGLEVIGIYAGRHSAEMIQIKRRINFAYELSIDKSMRAMESTFFAEVPVSMRNCSRPQPTTRCGLKSNLVEYAFW